MRDFSNSDDRSLFDGVKGTFRSFISRYAYSSSCLPFYNEILNRLRQSLLKDTYIDTLDRDIKLEIDCAKGVISVDITTRISYMSIQEGIPYFQVGPRFETLAQAESYLCVKFLLNDVDLTSQVDIQLRKCTDPKRQLPYIVDVTSLSRGTLGTHVLSTKRFIRFRSLRSSMPINLYFLAGVCASMRLLLGRVHICITRLSQHLARITYICMKDMHPNLGTM